MREFQRRAIIFTLDVLIATCYLVKFGIVFLVIAVPIYLVTL